jgi:hypothetical protein
VSVADPPLLPGRLYGLRTWRAQRIDGAAVLTGPYAGTAWPTGGSALRASCPQAAHAAPAPGCSCGLHAWHPRPPAARRVLAGRFEVPGILEAWGEVELHEDGFRAELGRPHTLVVAPGRHEGWVRELAAAYDAEVLAVRDPAGLLAHCRARDLGLSAPVVERLIGRAALTERRQARRRRRRADGARIAAAVALVTAVAGAGAYMAAHEPPGPKHLTGRTGPIVVP